MADSPPAPPIAYVTGAVVPTYLVAGVKVTPPDAAVAVQAPWPGTVRVRPSPARTLPAGCPATGNTGRSAVLTDPGSSSVAAGSVTGRLSDVVALSSVAVGASEVTRTLSRPTTAMPRCGDGREVSSTR